MKYFILCCSNNNIIDIIASIAEIIIAFLTLFLAYYVFIYQKRKDKTDENNRREEEKKERRVEWFKDIIIIPNICRLYDYYEEVESIKSFIKEPNLSEEEKINIFSILKNASSKLRKSFIVLLQHIDNSLYTDVLNNIDELTDQLTIVISNDEFELTHEKTYEREIYEKVIESHNKILGTLSDYDGGKRC